MQERKEQNQDFDQIRDLEIFQHILIQLQSFNVRLPAEAKSLQKIKNLVDTPVLNVAGLRVLIANILNADAIQQDYHTDETIKEYATVLHTLSLLLAKYIPLNQIKEGQLIDLFSKAPITSGYRILFGTRGYQMDGSVGSQPEGKEEKSELLPIMRYQALHPNQSPFSQNPAEVAYVKAREQSIRLQTGAPEIPEVALPIIPTPRTPHWCDYVTHTYIPYKVVAFFGGILGCGIPLNHITNQATAENRNMNGNDVSEILLAGSLSAAASLAVNWWVVNPIIGSGHYAIDKCRQISSLEGFSTTAYNQLISHYRSSRSLETIANHFFQKLIEYGQKRQRYEEPEQVAGNESKLEESVEGQPTAVLIGIDNEPHIEGQGQEQVNSQRIEPLRQIPQSLLGVQQPKLGEGVEGQPTAVLIVIDNEAQIEGQEQVNSQRIEPPRQSSLSLLGVQKPRLGEGKEKIYSYVEPLKEIVVIPSDLAKSKATATPELKRVHDEKVTAPELARAHDEKVMTPGLLARGHSGKASSPANEHKSKGYVLGASDLSERLLPDNHTSNTEKLRQNRSDYYGKLFSRGVASSQSSTDSLAPSYSEDGRLFSHVASPQSSTDDSATSYNVCPSPMPH